MRSVRKRITTKKRIFNCHLCDAPVQFVNNKKVYGVPYGDWPFMYLCTNDDCNAYVGVHINTTTPLGTMADRKTRLHRRKAHAAFDPLWKEGEMTRQEAYDWLSVGLGIDQKQCHIGMFNVDQCKKAVELIEGRGEDEGYNE